MLFAPVSKRQIENPTMEALDQVERWTSRVMHELPKQLRKHCRTSLFPDWNPGIRGTD